MEILTCPIVSLWKSLWRHFCSYRISLCYPRLVKRVMAGAGGQGSLAACPSFEAGIQSLTAQGMASQNPAMLDSAIAVCWCNKKTQNAYGYCTCMPYMYSLLIYNICMHDYSLKAANARIAQLQAQLGQSSGVDSRPQLGGEVGDLRGMGA